MTTKKKNSYIQLWVVQDVLEHSLVASGKDRDALTMFAYELIGNYLEGVN